MHMKQSPYQLHHQQFLSSSSSFYIMLHMCILWCVSSFKKKTYSEKYEWESLLLLSELSISALPSHSCLRVQELHTTQTDRHTHTHRQRRENAHETVSISASPSTVPVFKFKFLYYAPIILIFTYENKKYTRSSKLTM